MMRQRHKVFWLIGVVLFASWVLLLVLWGWREPSARGRNLSQWLQALDDPAVVTNVQTVAAFREMGGRAAVRLVPMLDAFDSELKLRLVEFAKKQNFVKVRFVPAALKRQRAVQAFEIMGDQGGAAAPALVALLLRRGSEPMGSADDPASLAGHVLSGLGHSAIPYLRPALCSRHSRIRYEGVCALRSCALDDAPETMTEVFRIFDDADPRVRQAGAEAMGYFWKQPGLIIARLARMLSDANPSVRKQAAYALGRFGRRATSAVAALQQAGSDAAPEVRRAATTALTRVGGGSPVSKDESAPGLIGKP